MLVACQMMVDLLGYQIDQFIPKVTEWVGATLFLPVAATADVGLFI
ncbi:DsrE/DsrF/DrsH-like family protein [Candidatus Reidiella endopervernicosa]|nr:DsrE/DsrF/DrsH-like family protein [Candidatus Reidiella endopervernicosa]